MVKRQEVSKYYENDCSFPLPPSLTYICRFLSYSFMYTVVPPTNFLAKILLPSPTTVSFPDFVRIDGIGSHEANNHPTLPG